MTPTELRALVAVLPLLSVLVGVVAGSRYQYSRERTADAEEWTEPDLSVRRVRLEPTESPDDRWTDEGGYSVLRGHRDDETDEGEQETVLPQKQDLGKAELSASNPGFRGRDLSDSEVEAWLKRFGL